MSHHRARVCAIATGLLALSAASVASAQQTEASEGIADQEKPDLYVHCPARTPCAACAPCTQERSETSTTQVTSAVSESHVAGEREHGKIRPNPVLLGTGAVLLVGPFIAGTIVAGTNSVVADEELYWPVAGPWLDLGKRDCTFGSECTGSDHVAAGLLIADGIAQGAGLAMIVASAFVPHGRAATSATAKQREKPHVSVAPASFAHGGGLGAAGTF